MELIDAFRIVKPSRPEFVLQADHICGETSAHDLKACPYGEPAVYTAFDALTDTPEALTARLSMDTSRLKPRIE
jgi:hypothetical protein